MSEKFKFDDRSLNDVLKQMKSLAKSYTPRWNFDTGNPDIGSTIGMIYASQMYDNVKKTNSLMDKYQIEFVNLLNLSLLPAFPAEGTITMGIISDTIEGTYVEKGTKLLATAEDQTNVVFETMQTTYVSGTALEHVIAVSRNQGKIIGFKGKLNKAMQFKGQKAEQEEEVKLAFDDEESKDELYLFDYRKNGVAQNNLVLYHESAFDVCVGGKILIGLKDMEGEEYEQMLDPKRYSFQYLHQGQKKEFGSIKNIDGIFQLGVEEELDKFTIDGQEYRCIIIEKKEIVKNSIMISDVCLASEDEKVKPDFIVFENKDLDVDSFMPFGDRAGLYSECYVGQDNVLSQKGAKIHIEFELDFAEKLITMTPEAEDRELKIIKRKPRKVEYEIGKTAIQKISLEYYNSRGWLSLPCHENYEKVFCGETKGAVKLVFTCPEDIQETTVGAFIGKSLRMRVLQADNCYMQPCKHYMPIISKIKMGYEYVGDWRRPAFLEIATGIIKKDITENLGQKNKATIFKPINCDRDSLLLGLSKKPMGAPFSLLFVLEDNVNFKSQNISFEYSTISGFKKLKTVDYTNGLRETGIVMMVTPSDFAVAEFEGIKKYWLRIVDDNSDSHVFDRTNPRIKKILVNGINIRNVETKRLEHFFIGNTEANLEYNLPYSNILKSEVFVNEKDSIPQQEVDYMLDTMPEDIRVEYDYLGTLKRLFIRWTEVDNFDKSKPTDRHYIIDRMANRLIFGDGINVKIPQASFDTAFTLQVMCCDGAKANIEANQIQTAMDRLPFIGKINNPMPTYGGSDIEKPESALQRGASMLSSKNRLVSALDFERDAKAHFSAIHKVKCVNNLSGEGEKATNEITMVLLTKEFEKGGFAFEAIAEKLKQRLLLKNEYVLNHINIVEPIFVNLEICIWVELEDKEKIFEIQNKFTDEIKSFIDPIEGCYGTGWDIGRLPSEHQLRMIMKRAENHAIVRRYIMTAKYIDSKGSHEVDYKEIIAHPFMVCTNGEHKVYLV